MTGKNRRMTMVSKASWIAAAARALGGNTEGELIEIVAAANTIQRLALEALVEARKEAKS